MCKNHILIASMKLQKLQVNHEPRDKALLTLAQDPPRAGSFVRHKPPQLPLTARLVSVLVVTANGPQSLKTPTSQCFGRHDYYTL